MRKWLIFIYVMSLAFIDVNAQTMKVNIGDVTYAIPASQTGIMNFEEGEKITILGKAYVLDHLTSIDIDSLAIEDNLVMVSYLDSIAKVIVSGNIVPYVTANVEGCNVTMEIENTSLQVTIILRGKSENGTFSLTGSSPTKMIFNRLKLSTINDAITIHNDQPVHIVFNNDDSMIFPDLDKDYPEYLKGEYQKTLADIKSVMTNESGMLLFSTDLHYSYYGSNYSEYSLMNGIDHLFASICKLCIDTHPDICVYGGDYIQLPSPQQGLTKEMGFKTLDYLNQQMSTIDIPQFLVMGNHEEFYTGNPSSVGMSIQEFYDYTQRQFVEDGTVMEVGASKCVFYRDDKKSHIRYLFLSTPRADLKELLDDVKAVAATTPLNYSLLVFNHFTGTALRNDSAILYEDVKKCLDVIRSVGVDFIAWIGGHNHADMFYDYEGMAVISCLQSGMWTPDYSDDGILYEHKKNDYTESALSAFIIRKDLGKIYLRRMGLGCDREINYNTTSGPVGVVAVSD